jgi:hypothetical protein
VAVADTEGDGDGHVQGEQSGTASFQVDADPCEDSDAEQVTAKDSGAHMDFHSTQVLSVALTT